MRKIYLLYIFLLFLYSCDVDSSKIIGTKIDMDKLPYGNYGSSAFDTVFINGIRYKAFSVYYKNKALTYIYNDDGIIVNYFFTNFISYKKAVKLFPIGTDYNDIVKKIGRPVTNHYASEEFGGIRDKKNEYIIALYYDKRFSETENEYEFSVYRTVFIFNLDWKLDHIEMIKYGI